MLEFDLDSLILRMIRAPAMVTAIIATAIAATSQSRCVAAHVATPTNPIAIIT